MRRKGGSGKRSCVSRYNVYVACIKLIPAPASSPSIIRALRRAAGQGREVKVDIRSDIEVKAGILVF